ncbi:MAG: hypothetical protein LBE82_13690, partial [Chitinophagaceae bacterium]|nr:hypothetical protein [Chitinophagaceae bacterium]
MNHKFFYGSTIHLYKNNLNKHIRIAVFNLMLVALLGALLRYKIAFYLPFIDQGFVLHAHSHFAFAGWVSYALMSLAANYLIAHAGIRQHTLIAKYNKLLYANLIAAYGMLFTFSFQGYGALSIAFSFVAIVVSYIFSICFVKDMVCLHIHPVVRFWFTGALFFNVLSSLGTFYLAYLTTHHLRGNLYLASVYFYLHFQYNGWFLFACIGLLYTLLPAASINIRRNKLIFFLFFFACIPEYLFSVLWMKLPPVIYFLVVLSAASQLTGLLFFLRFLKQNFKNIVGISKQVKAFFIVAGLALIVKILLQTGSIYIPLNKLVFGFRPIVIGYLHLVFLGVITTFLLGFMQRDTLKFKLSNASKTSLSVFVASILLNEALLMLQGISSLYYIPIPNINYYLLIAALIMWASIAYTNYEW